MLPPLPPPPPPPLRPRTLGVAAKEPEGRTQATSEFYQKTYQSISVCVPVCVWSCTRAS